MRRISQMAGLRMGRNWRRSDLLGLTSLNEGSQWRGPESSARNGRTGALGSIHESGSSAACRNLEQLTACIWKVR